jgi:hypothetical protein
MPHIKAIILKEPINLLCAHVLTTFQKKLDLVVYTLEKVRLEAELEAAQAQTELEAAQAQTELEAAQAPNQGEVDDVEFEDHGYQAGSDWDCNGYNSYDDQCGCHSAFGKDDDGEVRHYGLDCPYDF